MQIDLHAHTRFGSNCSYLPPDELAKQARAVGLDAICITEHNLFWEQTELAKLSSKHGVLVLGGVEVSTDHGDVLVYGLREPVVGVGSLNELRRLVDEAGGVMIAAHPFRRDAFWNGQADVDEVAARPVFKLVDAVEIFNGMSSRKEIGLGQAVASRLGLRGTGGSDTHAIHTVGQCVTVFERRISDELELVAELKAGRYRAAHRLMKLVF